MRSRFVVALAGLLAACSGGGGPIDPSPAGAVVRGPQLAQAQADSMVVAWRSATPVLGAITCSSGQRLAGLAPSTEHVFTLTGLAADTAYEYALEHDGVTIRRGHGFRTSPPSGTGTVRFVVVGDSGAGTDAQRDVAFNMAASNPDLVLIAGDVIYETGAEADLDGSYFLPYRALLEQVPFYPAIGNHDVMTENGRPLLDSVYLPRNSADGSERYYSFERGPVHFVALDSNQELSPGSPQGDWLAADLAVNARAWTVLYLHHPPYSSSLHGSDLGIRAALLPLCDARGVDVVFAGHDHVYERTHPMAGDVVVDSDPGGNYVEPSGTVFVVTGGGGKSLYPAGQSDFTALSVSAYHHVVVAIDGVMLRLDAIGIGGANLDSLTIEKTR